MLSSLPLNDRAWLILKMTVIDWCKILSFVRILFKNLSCWYCDTTHCSYSCSCWSGVISKLRLDTMFRISLLVIEISLVLMFVFTDGKLYYQPFLVGWLGLINCLRLILKSTGWGEGVNTYFPFHLFNSNLYSFCVG